MGGKSSPPPAPDYTGAALAEAQASRENLNTQNYANRPTINTPWGTQSWQTNATIDPATGQAVTQWTQNTSLTPESQAALDSQMALQQGRSDLANSFMGRVGSEFSQPFDYSNLPNTYTPSAPRQLDAGPTSRAGALQSGINPNTANLQSSFSFGQPQSSLAMTNVQSSVDPMLGGIARTGNDVSVQRGLNMSDNPALPQFDSSYRDTVANQLMERMQPQFDRQQGSLETQLANQGFERGSQAYTQALDDMQERQSRERFNALDMAGSEAQRLYGMQMGARQQAFSEDQGAGSFANSAAGQAFNQGMSLNQFQNQANNQAYNQSLGAGNFANNAAQQQFGQNLNAGQFANQAMQQDYSQQMGAANLNNQTAQQAFGQNLQAANFGNQAATQGQNLDMTSMQARNNALQTQQNMDAAYANQMNTLRQQAIAEQAQRRGMSLNEMNALLSGQQVSMPNMPSFTNAGISQTPQLMNAAQNQYSAAMDAFNIQQQQQAGMMGGLSSLASTAMMFSDRRLKRRIKRVGTHAIGVGIYDYQIFGYPQRGVLAQEVQAVRPDLVKTHPSGFLTVNYGGL